MKLRLINPVSGNYYGLSKTNSNYPPLGLGIVAALTPPTWEIELIDENIEEHQFGEADLVAISCFTATVTRGYEIALEYRKKGIPVVMGGIHVSLHPKEALNYATSIVIGEAETNWHKVIKDAEKGLLKKIYKSENCEGKDIPFVKREIFHPSYQLGLVQASRGCPFRCEFCSLTVFNGSKCRTRPVENVIKEIESIPQDFFWFVDNNLFGNTSSSEKWAMALLSEMKSRGIKKTWLCFTNLRSANSDKMLKLAYDAGCRMIYLGVESEQNYFPKNAVNDNAGENNISGVFAKIHKHGIAIHAGIIMGLESDTVDSIRQRTDFILKSDIDCYMISALTPFPGTTLFERMLSENRIIYNSYPHDWEKYTWKNPVFHPKKMSHDEFCSALYESYGILYSYRTIRQKYRQTLNSIGDSDTAFKSYLTNKDYASVFINT